MSGVNLIGCEGQDAVALNTWYSGPTLVELLGLYSSTVAGSPKSDPSGEYRSTPTS